MCVCVCVSVCLCIAECRYLERETFAHLQSQLALVTPDVAQFIKLCGGMSLLVAVNIDEW